MKTKIIVSNVRFPEDEWLQLKTVASARGMSVNGYIKYLTNIDSVDMITGPKNIKTKKTGYDALGEFIEFAKKNKGKGMGTSEEDKIIYDIE